MFPCLSGCCCDNYLQYARWTLSCCCGAIETLNTDIHMGHVIVSEVVNILVIKSCFSKQNTAGYKEVKFITFSSRVYVS